ncbi:MAG: hypothetical protein ACFFED_14930 [Candidatus Thorarchaeota archaeon]
MERLENVLSRMSNDGFNIQASVVINERGLTMASMAHRNWSADKIAAMVSLISDGATRALSNLSMGSLSTISIASEKATLWIAEFDVNERQYRIAIILGHGPLRIRSFWDRVRNRDFVTTILLPSAKKIQNILGGS